MEVYRKNTEIFSANDTFVEPLREKKIRKESIDTGLWFRMDEPLK